MADHSRIEWTDATWNPVTGCTLVSEGCRNCYAAELAAGRLRHHPSRAGLARRNAAGVAQFTGEVRLNERWLDQPLRWRRPRRIFVCAHGDLFHESVPDSWIDRVFAVMAAAPRHQFQVLTKRPERMLEYISDVPETEDGIFWAVRQLCAGDRREIDAVENRGWPLPNVWIGVSVEDQATADDRISALLDTPAAGRFLSAEPLLAPLDLRSVRWGQASALTGLDWVIVGGESGPRARPMHPDWVRSLRDQCKAWAIPFFFKQWGEWAPDDGPYADCDPIMDGTAHCAWWDGAEWHFAPGDYDVPRDAKRHGECVYHLGRKRAGRLLDDEEWNEMPEAAP